MPVTATGARYRSLPLDRWAEFEGAGIYYATETSQPGVFAAGDVRAGSIKRVAAAVGEGASAIRCVHAIIGSAVI